MIPVLLQDIQKSHPTATRVQGPAYTPAKHLLQYWLEIESRWECWCYDANAREWGKIGTNMKEVLVWRDKMKDPANVASWKTHLPLSKDMSPNGSPRYVPRGAASLVQQQTRPEGGTATSGSR
jgi:hypothetical protein